MSFEHRHMPDINRVSVLLAAVLLSYALAQLIEIERTVLRFSFLGIDFSLPFNYSALATLLVAGLTASGVNWLLHGHPHYDGRRTFQHWIMPALTAFILGVPLYNFEYGLAWWLSYVFGGILLLAVLLAEYIALDASDVRHPAASAGLMALSFALFLILASFLSYAGVRLAFMAVAVFLAAGMVTLRSIHLQSGTWDISWAVVSAFIVTQLAAALHYWPVSPLQFGLILLGVLYALTGLTLNVREQVSLRRVALELLLGLGAFWTVALLFGK